jgi:hypothetical protein
MTIEVQKQYELDVEKLVDQMSPGHKHLMYRYLYHDGCSMASNTEQVYKIKDYVPLKLPVVIVQPPLYDFC